MRRIFLQSRFRRTCLGLFIAGLLYVPGEAKAVSLSGSFPLAGFNVSGNKATLGASTKFTASFAAVTSPGVGDYSPISTFTFFTPSVLDLTALSSFTLSNATFGSFVADSVGNLIVNHSVDFLEVFLVGTFTPGSGLPGFGPSATSLRISINQGGKSFSEALTLNSSPSNNPPALPEPGTLLLLGSGLIALFANHKQFAKH